jgi:alkylation response protein AidB-like acyl-CoA dehydrogenase
MTATSEQERLLIGETWAPAIAGTVRDVLDPAHYRALVQAGLLRRLIPPPLGGEMTSLVDLAIEAEELMAVETSMPRSVFCTGLGLMPCCSR